MSGHSKWSQIKRQKGVADARRGQLFTKLSREISLAARQGGTSPESNFRLRLAVQKAKDNNMPLENIERAIKRAAGAVEGGSLTEMLVEGYGPGGVAIMVEAVTDNRNRTIQDIRHLFARAGGSLGESGSVSWQFNATGVIVLDITSAELAEEIGLLAIDAGAEDVKAEENFVEIHTQPAKLEEIRRVLEEHNLPIASAEVSLLPQAVVRLEDKEGLATLRLLDRLEELAEVQRLYSNADFSDATLEVYRKELEVAK